MHEQPTLELALSGGGSRAAAFHRGTLRALEELDLTDNIDVISSVSGGSLFAAAWMASKIENQPTETFLNQMKEDLKRGFVLRSIRPLGVLKTMIPGINYSRINLIADTFNRTFFDHKGFKNSQSPFLDNIP